MKEFKVGKNKYHLVTSWDDMTLGEYLQFYKRHSQRENKEVDDIYLIQLVELFSGCSEILNLPQRELIPLIESLNFLLKKPRLKDKRTIKVGDKTYSFIDFNSMSAGEYISIKTFQKDIPNHLDAIPYILSIILRPSTITIDKETGDQSYEPEEFKVDNLAWRAKNYPQMFKAVDVMQWITFFLTMSNGLQTTTQRSIKEPLMEKTIPSPQKSQNTTIG